MSRRSMGWILAVVATAAAAALVVRMRAEAPTDEEKIQALVEGAARAAEERRVSDAVEIVSERFHGEGLDRRGVKQVVAFHVLRGDWVSVSITGSRVRVAGQRARANVDAVLARGGAAGKPLSALLPGEASAHRFECALEREAEGWRIVEAAWRPVALADALAGPPDPGAPAVR